MAAAAEARERGRRGTAIVAGALGMTPHLIAATTTSNGMKVRRELDRTPCPKGIKVSDNQMAELHVERDPFHGDWNYTLIPRTGRRKAG